MLHNDDRVAEVAKLFEHPYQALGVAAVQTYRRLVEYVHRAHQRRPQRRGQVYPLALATAEAAALAVQREVAKAHVEQVSHTVVQLGAQALGGLQLGRRHLRGETLNPHLHLGDRHRHHLADAAAANLHIVGVFAQPSSVTIGTHRAATIARQHDAVLYLVSLALHPTEEAVDALPHAVAVPEDVLLLVAQLVVGLVYRKVNHRRMAYKLALDVLHFVAVPADDGVVVYRTALVGHHEVLVDAYHAAVPLACGAGTIGVVEGEEIGVGLLEGDAVGLEAVAEGGLGTVGRHHALAATFEEGTLHALGHTGGLRVVGMAYLHTVNHQPHASFELHGVEVLDAHHRAFDHYALVALLVQYLYLALQRALLAVSQRRQYHHPRAVGESLYIVDHVAHRVALHLHTAHRREGAAHTGVHQLQVLVNLRLRAHRRARVAGVHLLLYGHRRRQPVYVVDIGLRHATQELARVGAHTLHVAALPFGEESVEGKTRFAAAAQTRHHHKLALRQRDVDILQVIGPRTFDFYIHNSTPPCHFTLSSTTRVRLPSCVYNAITPSGRTKLRTRL